MHRLRIVFVAAMAIALVTLSIGTQAASSFANPAFQTQWNAGEALTQNFWGPLSTAKDGQQEPYQEASGGQRLVQYFDKGRMELTNGTVTNGLLATEIVKGQIQVGDSSFQPKASPEIPIAGDPDNAGPTYAQLNGKARALFDAAPQQTGNTTQAAVSPSGDVSASNAGSGGAVTFAVYDDATKHNVPQAFADYRSKAGVLTIGYALCEPFFASVKVAGAQKQVMVQVFERRVLTYTASNDPAFQVEMGNIGQHYFQWRYPGGSTTPPAGTGQPPLDLTNAFVYTVPPGWTREPGPYPSNVASIVTGPTPTLKLVIQIYDTPDPLDSVVAGFSQAARTYADGSITREDTASRQIGGEPAKVYTFSGTRADKSPVSGLFAVVVHKGKEYDFLFLANTATLPDRQDIDGILTTVTFQS